MVALTCRFEGADGKTRRVYGWVAGMVGLVRRVRLAGRVYVSMCLCVLERVMRIRSRTSDVAAGSATGWLSWLSGGCLRLVDRGLAGWLTWAMRDVAAAPADAVGCAYILDPRAALLRVARDPASLEPFEVCGAPRASGTRFCEPHRFEIFGPLRKRTRRSRCRGAGAPCQRFAGADGYCRNHREQATAGARERRALHVHELVRIGGRYADVCEIQGTDVWLAFEDGNYEWLSASEVIELDECEALT